MRSKINYPTKVKSPSVSSDDSTSSGGGAKKRTYYQRETHFIQEMPYVAGTPQELELKRKRLDLTSRNDFVSIVTKQKTFAPTLPRMLQ